MTHGRATEWGHPLNPPTGSSKKKMIGSRSSKICLVVKRLDHHSGVDLVLKDGRQRGKAPPLPSKRTKTAINIADSNSFHYN